MVCIGWIELRRILRDESTRRNELEHRLIRDGNDNKY